MREENRERYWMREVREEKRERLDERSESGENICIYSKEGEGKRYIFVQSII